MKLSIGISVCFLYLIFSFSVNAQTRCDSSLAHANEYYINGLWDEAINMVRQCLNQKNVSDKFKGKSYHLLALIYNALGEEAESKDAVKNLLLSDPDYNINPETDPPNLQSIIFSVAGSLSPEINSVTPLKIDRGNETIEIEVTGSNFPKGSSIQIDDEKMKTKYAGTEKLTATVITEELPEKDKYQVRVYSPILGGRLSNALYIKTDVSKSAGRLRVFVRAGISLPLGTYGSSEGNEGDGAAKTGFGAMGDLFVPLGPNGLGWFSSLGIFFHGYNDEAIRNVFSDEGLTLNENVSGYINIPVLTGIAYMGNLSQSFAYLLNLKLGLAFINGPGLDGTFESSDFTGTSEFTYDMATSFSFSLGAGFIIADRFHANFEYLNMGKPERNYTWKIDLRDRVYGVSAVSSESYEEKTSISVFLITFGIIF